MRSYSKFLKIAPAFLIAGTMVQAQVQDSAVKERKIEEVVLIGYGAKKKTDLTGSITAISSKDFQEGAIGSPEQLIQGKAAGIQISTGGAPGSGAAIRIRGGSSLNASNDPLIVIDGVPVDNGGIDGAANVLALINPNDIESFNILKDASAAAIYGNRAANGVIIITTKKGAAGRFRVNYSTVTSAYTRMGSFDMLSANQFRDVVTQHAPTSYVALLGNADTDWQKTIYQTALGFDNNLTLSGGIKGLPYRISLGYLNQEGIIKTNKIERSTVGINLNPKLFDKHLDININAKGTYAENRFNDGGAIGASTIFDPTQPVYDASMQEYGGYWEWLNASTRLPNVNATKNPMSLLQQKFDYSYVTRFIGNAQLDYKFHFLPELRANLNLGMDYSTSNGNTTFLPTAAAVYYDKGTYRRYSQEKKNKLLEFYLNYQKNIPSINSNIDITAGYSYQDWQTSAPFSPTYLGTGVLSPESGIDTFYQNTLLSYFGRLNYTFNNKYLLTASLRRDASSRFSPDNRVGYFPAVALAWRIDQENFLQDTAISTLKLRLGWGKTGQQDISSNYPYLPLYTYSDSGAMYQFGDTFYTLLRPSGYDPNIKWEIQETKNIGLDFGFLNNRISGSIDYFYKNITDLLSVVSQPGGSNFTNMLFTNVGNMTNKGIEFALNVKPIQTNDFSWEFSANVTHFDPKITSLSRNGAEAQAILTGGISGATGQTAQIHTVGNRPSAFYVYQQVYDTNGKPIEGVYVDRNGDGIINSEDLYAYKSPLADVLIGFSNTLNYKNWDFGFTLRASIGNYVYNNGASQWGNLQGIGLNNYIQNIHSSFLETGFERSQLLSDYYVENASFLRLDNVNLGYNFPEFINKSRLRIYASAQNVFVLTKYSGIDPEVFGGIDNSLYQRPKIYSLGLNLQF